jgi:hypothetical protein
MIENFIEIHTNFVLMISFLSSEKTLETSNYHFLLLFNIRLIYDNLVNHDQNDISKAKSHACLDDMQYINKLRV